MQVVAFRSSASVFLFAIANCGDPIGVADPVPGLTDLESIATLLETSGYSTWSAEPGVHDGSGPHGQVRVYFNPPLAASIMSGQSSHPDGSIAVKELYATDAVTIRAYAIGIKDRAAPEAQSWVWYEADRTSLRSPDFYARASPTCADCHDHAAVDSVYSSL